MLKNILKNNACALWSRAAMHDIGATTVTFYYQLRKIDRKHIDFLFSFKKKLQTSCVTQSRKNLCDYLTAHTWRRRRVQWCAAQSDLCVIV